jgi:hypothetical protein
MGLRWRLCAGIKCQILTTGVLFEREIPKRASCPVSRVREVNRVLEDTAWGAYRRAFYPTYDYKAVGTVEHDKAQ